MNCTIPASLNNTLASKSVFSLIIGFAGAKGILRLGRTNRYFNDYRTPEVCLKTPVLISQVPIHTDIQIESVIVSSEDALKRLCEDPIFSKVHTVKFNNRFNSRVKDLPAGIKTIIFGNDYARLDHVLPEGVEKIVFGYHYLKAHNEFEFWNKFLV